MDSLRLIANPLLLNDVQQNDYNINNISFKEKLKILLQSEFDNVYLSDKWISELNDIILDKIDSLMIYRIVEECINDCIGIIIQENKFDFHIPFD